MKTVISANIPISTAIKLKDKAKGTRSMVISKALEAYLEQRDAFDMYDIDIIDILNHLYTRHELSPTMREIVYQMKTELKE